MNKENTEVTMLNGFPLLDDTSVRTDKKTEKEARSKKKASNSKAKPAKPKFATIAQMIKEIDEPTIRRRAFIDGFETAPDGTTQMRLLYGQTMVYMAEANIPKIIKSVAGKEDLSKYQVIFYPLKYENDRLYVACPRKKRMTTGLPDGYLKGVAVGVQVGENEPNEDCLIVQADGVNYYLARPNIHYLPETRDLNRFIGKEFIFKLTEVDEDGRKHVSARELLEAKRDKVIERLQSGEVVEAEVTSLPDFGARVRFHNVLMLMRDKDFSSDYTKMRTVYNIGDVIRVKLSEISATKRIFVEPEFKYASPVDDYLAKVTKGECFEGSISTVCPFGCFVNIFPGLDVLCPMPESVNPVSGLRVTVKIIKVDEQTGRARGDIINAVDAGDGVEFLVED